MYPHDYIIPNNSNTMYRNTNYLQPTYTDNSGYYDVEGDRFFLAPLVVGGLAGTALGFGIANNNQLNRPQCCPYPIFATPMPYYPQNYPTFTSTTNNNNNNSFYG